MKFGNYTSLDVIGHGASSYVYKVTDGINEYAVKACTRFDDESRKRFAREIRIAQAIHHPNVVNIYEHDMDRTCPYYVMDLCDTTLAHECGKLTQEDRFKAALQLCHGLKQLHDNRILHRDIKPSNVLIKSGIIKIADFSLGFFTNHDSTTLTSKDVVIGTEGYIAPEIYSDGGHKATTLSDIYSLGCTLFHLFSGGLQPQYYDPKQMPPNVVAIVEKCRAINPEDRFQSVDEVISELNALLSVPKFLSMQELYYNKSTMSKAEYRNQGYTFLMNEVKWDKMISDIILLGSEGRVDILKNIPDSGDKILLLLENVKTSDDYTWKQFEDIDPFTEFCAEVFANTKSVLTKQKALDISLPFAVENTRWNALRVIYNRMLTQLTDAEVRQLSGFFLSHKENLLSLENEIGVNLPQSIKNVL